MNFKQYDELSEREKSMFEIAQETGLDHYMSLWNAVDKRIPELGKELLTAEIISLQLNAGAICAAHLLTHVLTKLQNVTEKQLLELFIVTVVKAIRTQLEAMKQEMH